MRTPYLTTLSLVLVILLGTVALFGYATDPFGLYRDGSAKALSRIDQFYHMRSTKPLQLVNKKPQRIIVGSSRAARLSPSERNLTDIYNAAIPGATPNELRDTLSFAHNNAPLEEAYIGWDFESFLGLTNSHRAGFNTELMQASNPITSFIQTVIAHMRTLFSFIAIKGGIATLHASESSRGPLYLDDGSWRRDKLQNIGPFGFALVSKDKAAKFGSQDSFSLLDDEITKTLDFCYREKIPCTFFATPVHLFHLEIFEAAGLLPLWEEWHRRIVTINEDLASQYQVTPFTIWGFNAVEVAVTERIAKPADLETPWFTDNVHFRPRFGHLILDALLENATQAGETELTTANVDKYLNEVQRLREKFTQLHAKQVRRMKKNFNIE